MASPLTDRSAFELSKSFRIPHRIYLRSHITCHQPEWMVSPSSGLCKSDGPQLVLGDLAQWGHNTEHTGPISVEGKGDVPPHDAVHNTVAEFDLHYKYADGVTMTYSAGQGDLDPKTVLDHNGPIVGRTPVQGIRFEGTEGWIESYSWRGWVNTKRPQQPLRASQPSMLNAVIDPDKVKIYRPSEIVRFDDHYRGGEHRNFIDCVKSRQPCYDANAGRRPDQLPRACRRRAVVLHRRDATTPAAWTGVRHRGTRFPRPHASIANAVATCVFPVPGLPIRITDSQSSRYAQPNHQANFLDPADHRNVVMRIVRGNRVIVALKPHYRKGIGLRWLHPSGFKLLITAFRSSRRRTLSSWPPAPCDRRGRRPPH